MKEPLLRNDRNLLIILLLINAIGLVPLLFSGYLSDDIYNSQIRGAMLNSGHSLWEVMAQNATFWIKTQGRFFPLALYGYAVFYVLNSIVLYKLFVFATILASIAAFFLFVRRLSGRTSLAAICLLILPLFLQFRIVWDPVLSFCAQYPMLAFALFASLNLFLEWLDTSQPGFPVMSVVLFACCCLVFEISYLLCVLYLVLAVLRLSDLRLALRVSGPFLAVTLLLTLISVGLRFQVAPSGAYKPDLRVMRVIASYGSQLFGTVPFSYSLIDPQNIFQGRSTQWGALVALLGLFAACSAWAAWNLLPKPENGRAWAWIEIATAVLLLTLPPILISTSPKYQEQPLGDAYLPVYIGMFGACFLASIVLERLHLWGSGRWKSPIWVYGGLAIWIILFSVNLHHNALVVQAANQTFWEPRKLVEDALRDGLLDGVGKNAIILVRGTDPWDNADEYSVYAKEKIHVYPLNAVPDLTPQFKSLGATCETVSDEAVCNFMQDTPAYSLEIRHLSDGKGAVLLSRLRRSVQKAGTIQGVFSDEVLAYFQMPPSAAPLVAAIAGRAMQRSWKDGSVVSFRIADQGGLQTVRSGPTWKLLRLRRDSLFDALSLRGEISVERAGSALLSAKSRDSFELHGDGPELFHVGYNTQDLGSGVKFPPLTLGRDVSIELLVTPDASQVVYANIFGNHSPDMKGFCLEQVETRTNEYSLAFGSGKGWMVAGTFSLQPGKRSYISIQKRDTEIKLYINGVQAASKVLPDAFAESPLPFEIGNWVGGGRQFNGWIEELLISTPSKSGAIVAQTGMSLRTRNRIGKAGSTLLLEIKSQVLAQEVAPADGAKPGDLPAGISMPDSFTIEMVLRPDAYQTANATLISNHPGTKGFQGWTLEQPNDKTNWYHFGGGNGKTWMSSNDFYLSPGSQHYMALIKDKRMVRVFVDGRQVAERSLEGEIAPSDYPIVVGDWIGKTRRFSGLISELRISEGALSGAAIETQAHALKGN